jgi:hypothetical protein
MVVQGMPSTVDEVLLLVLLLPEGVVGKSALNNGDIKTAADETFCCRRMMQRTALWLKYVGTLGPLPEQHLLPLDCSTSDPLAAVVCGVLTSCILVRQH